MQEVVRARCTRATWTGGSEAARVSSYDVEPAGEVTLPGQTLWLAVNEQERRKQNDSYCSTLDSHESGEVWVHWEQGSQVGSDRYQAISEFGVRLGGCQRHPADRCWWIGSSFPPLGSGVHIVIASLSRLAAHRDCEWAAVMGALRSEAYLQSMPRSVGAERCCNRPYALTESEQVEVTLVARGIADAVRPSHWVRNFDLLVGWRLFGVYDAKTRWPGLTPLWDLDRSVIDCWLVQLALQELA